MDFTVGLYENYVMNVHIEESVKNGICQCLVFD